MVLPFIGMAGKRHFLPLARRIAHAVMAAALLRQREISRLTCSEPVHLA
jgi:hypothetical protein